MKKRLTSLIVAIAMVSTIILGSVGSLVGLAATIDKSGYPFANNRELIKLDFSTTGTNLSDISVRLITTDNFAIEEGVLKVTQNHINSNAYFRYKTAGRAESALGMSIHIDNRENGAVSFGFVPHLDSTFTVASGAKYYLISDAGVYEEFAYNSSGKIDIPAAYSGKIVVPFSNFTGIDVQYITGFRVNLTGVAKDESKHLYFDNFAYIGEVYSAGEISPDEFPYTLEDSWDEFDYTSVSPFSPVGAVVDGAFSVKNGSFCVGLDTVGAGNGFSMNLTSTYSSKYDAAYFVIDPSSVSSDIMIKAVWAIKGNTCTVKAGGDYYVRLSDGRVFKYQATSEGEIRLPSGISKYIAEVAVPFDSMVLSGTETGAGKPDITGLTVTFDGLTANGSDEIAFNSFGYVKATSNSFYVPPKMTGTVVPEAELLVNMKLETKTLLTGAEELLYLYGCETGVDQRDISYAGGKLGIPISGNPYFTWTVSGANAYQGVSFEIDVLDVKKSVNLSLAFTASSKTGTIKEGGIYYLKSDHDGLFYKYYQTEAGAKSGVVEIPMNFKGKVIVPFESLNESETNTAFTPTSSTTLRIDLKGLNGTNKKKFIRFSNLVLHKSDDWIGDNAYKIPVGISNVKVVNKAEWDLSTEQPQSDSDKAYIWKDYTEFYTHSFTTESAYSGTAQKILAMSDFTSRKIVSGNALTGSWTNYSVNAFMIWIDTTHAPNANMQFYTSGADKEGKTTGTNWLGADSKVFLYNEKTGKAKLATISGQDVYLDGYKGWIILPVRSFKDADPAKYASIDDISLTRGFGMNVYIGGMKTGDYIIVDQSQVILFEAPSEMPTFIPDIGYLDTDQITGETYIPMLDGSYISGGSAATGVETIDVVCAVAVLGTVSLGVGIYSGKRKKEKKR